MDAYQFWVKVFALTFALAVVSGITMSFQFGTNWPGFMNTVGNVAGPLLAHEVLTAFWILALNSWMHTPAGFELIDGKAHLLCCLRCLKRTARRTGLQSPSPGLRRST